MPDRSKAPPKGRWRELAEFPSNTRGDSSGIEAKVGSLRPHWVTERVPVFVRPILDSYWTHY